MPLLDLPTILRCRRLAQIAREAAARVAAAQGKPPAGPWEWSGHRDYSPGDDYLAVDRGICARHDELRVRTRASRSAMRLHVLLDCSRSMGLGNPPKFDAARRAVAVIGCMAASELVELRVSAFAQRAVAEFTGGRGEAALARLTRFLDSLTPDGMPTDFAQATEPWARGRLGPVVVVSDLYEWPGFESGLKRLCAAGWPPCVIQWHDRLEARPQWLGDVELADVETGASWEVTLTERDLTRYAEQFAAFLRDVRAWCLHRGISLHQVPADAGMEEPLWRQLGPVILGGPRPRSEAVWHRLPAPQAK